MSDYDLLIVEDDAALREALVDTLEMADYRIITANNGTEALSKLTKHRVKLVLSDVQMPVMDGLQLLSNLRHQQIHTPFMLMTAYGTIPKAVEAMQFGASDYLIKPFAADHLLQKVESYFKFDFEAPEDEIATDPVMQRLMTLVKKIAKTDVAVLLQGESGTGKEVLARTLHRESLHHQGPFIAINCAAIPENMLEAMLFGYDKGAFTGAVQSMPGKFEMAQGGTLLLDEISEMDLALQAKLLRVLQEKELERLGSNQKIHLNVRILATTNRHLKTHVNQGLFREDLYYRLSVFPLTIPPLRQRSADLLPLANSLLRRHVAMTKQSQVAKVPELSTAATEKLLAYTWPGNVRELENVMQRALILHQNQVINPDDLVFESDVVLESDSAQRACRIASPSLQGAMAESSAKLDEGRRLAEEQMILQILQEQQGNRKNTATKLGVSDRTLRYKIARMKEAGIVMPC